jgi:hypothetical protein
VCRYAEEEMIYACMAAPLAIQRAGWPVPPHPSDINFTDPR